MLSCDKAAVTHFWRGLPRGEESTIRYYCIRCGSQIKRQTECLSEPSEELRCTCQKYSHVWFSQHIFPPLVFWWCPNHCETHLSNISHSVGAQLGSGNCEGHMTPIIFIFIEACSGPLVPRVEASFVMFFFQSVTCWQSITSRQYLSSTLTNDQKIYAVLYSFMHLRT